MNKKQNTLTKNFEGWSKSLATLFGIAFLFMLWGIIYASIHDPIVFPGPYETILAFGKLFVDPALYRAIGQTLLRLLISSLISFTAALVLGVIGGLSSWFNKFINPLIVVLRTVPTAAVVFILIVLSNPHETVIIVTFLIMFPVLYETISGGIRNIDPSVKESLKLETSLWSPKSIFTVLLPCASNYILIGLFQSIGLGMKVGIMSEILTGTLGAMSGIGLLIFLYKSNLDMDYVFALCIYSFILVGLVDLLLNITRKKLKK